MSRSFKTADYDATLEVTVRLGDCLPPDHLARFVVDTIAHLDLAAIYTRYGPRGGQPYAPEILLALLFYGYATGTFSTRKLERATYETVPFRFLAGNLHPDHDTLATFRKTFLPELKDLFVKSCCWRRWPGRSNWATSVSTAPRSMPMPPRARPSAISTCWRWKHTCVRKSRSCSP